MSAIRPPFTLEASINDVPIEENHRKFHWAAPGPRPKNDTGIPNVA